MDGGLTERENRNSAVAGVESAHSRLFVSSTEALCVREAVHKCVVLSFTCAAAVSGEETVAETAAHRGESISDN